MRDFLEHLIEPEQRSQELHDQRIGKPTASEFHRIITPCYTERPMTPKELAARPEKGKGSSTNFVKVEVIADLSKGALTYVKEKVAEHLTGYMDTFTSIQTSWGIDNEEAAKLFFQERTGLEVLPAYFVPYLSISGGTPDGYVGPNAILELKCPFSSAVMVDYFSLNAETFKEDYCEYYWQCQGNMLFTKRDTCYFAVYDPRMPDDFTKMVIIVLKANPEDQRYLLLKLEAFHKEWKRQLAEIENKFKPLNIIAA
jgi:hypothetical protein